MKYESFRIGEICDIVKGTYPTLKTEPGPYPLVVTASFRRSASSYQLLGPAVCVPLISSTGHGDAAIHRLHYQEGPFALANLLVALLPKNSDTCDAKYLYYLLTAKKDEYFVPLMQGTANVSLKERDIADVAISLPPFALQRQIVARIEKVAMKIDAVRRCDAGVEQDSEMLLNSVFARLIENAPRRPLGQVAPLIRRPIHIDPLGRYRELGIRSFGKGTIHKPQLMGAELGSKRVFEIHPGDLIFSNVFAWEGAVAVAGDEDRGRIGSHRFITCVPHPSIATAKFLRFFFLTSVGLKRLGEASPGGAGRNRTLGLEALAKIEVPVPDCDRQIWFDSLQDLFAAVEVNRRARTCELDVLLPSFLNLAFREVL